MGYVKYREDDIKISEARDFSKHGFISKEHKQPVQYFECRYCHALFTDKESLFLHIKSEHNIVRPILCINGKVVNDDTVLQHVESCVIYTYGFDDEIKIDDNRVNNLKYDDSIDVTDEIKTKLFSFGACEVSFGNSKINVALKKYVIESKEMVADTLAKWQTAAESGKVLDTSIFTIITGSDKLFLEGMYNYYLACNAKHDKAKRYDDAYAKLSLFHDIQGIGRCALKVIAFRRNWISSLKVLSSDVSDVFSIACEFYDNSNPVDVFEDLNGEKSLYLEDAIADSLELIKKYQHNRLDELEKTIPTLEKIEQLPDPNISDQIKLVKAKLENKKGNLRQCRRCVDSIINTQLREIGFESCSIVAGQ